MSTLRTEYTRDPLIRAFGTLLRAYRERAKLSRAQLAEALGCTGGWIEKMETGKKPSIESAIDLDTYFQIPEQTFTTMADEIENAGRRQAATRPPGFDEYVEREAQARESMAVDVALVHGLLQSEGYARAILSANQNPEVVEQHLSDRLQRQQLLDGQLRAYFTIDEMVLRRAIGGPEVMREQLTHLLEISERPNIMLEVIPANSGYHPGLGGSFTLLRFDNAHEVAYIEAAGQGSLFQEPRVVAEIAMRYNMTRGHALPVDESRAVIENVRNSP